MTTTAYFLWIGGDLPEMARISVLSAAEAGFDTVLFSDRQQRISHPKVRIANWREVDLPWSPTEVRLKGEDRPCYAAFSDLFRFALLSQTDGWWIDCDTIVLRPVDDFESLMRAGHITVGREDEKVINGAILGSMGRSQAQLLLDAALPLFPILERWGVVGPTLITQSIEQSTVRANVLDEQCFYPIHHSDIASIFLPSERERLLAEEPRWFCLSLWGEVLARSGLRYLEPPAGSYLADLLARRPELGRLRGNRSALAGYLADNLRRLDNIDSGRLALQTLLRKTGARLRLWSR